MPVTVNTDLPLLDERDRDWDGDAARAAMARRCANDDGVMADCMGPGFVWRDPDANAATIGAYALPVADVVGGELRLVLSGAQAAARSISPEATPGEARAQSGTEAELGQMRTAVAAILRRFAEHFDDEALRAPWDRPESETAAATAAACGCNCGCKPTEPITEPRPQGAPEAPKEAVMTTPIVPQQRSRVLRASATGTMWNPPTDHFANPHLAEPTKLTVTADGRVYGHLATWDQPHIGYDGKLVYPPKNSTGAYEYFRQSKVVTADGAALAVGLITMATGHADESLSADAAASHYDNTGTMVAACNIGEDGIGIWIAGSLLPDVSPDQRNRFALARVSGDWRQPYPGAPLELIAALSVPNPGFPVRQPAELLQADRMTLAASGLVRAEGGEIRTFITAGAAVVDQAANEALVEAVKDALAGPLVEQIKAAVIEALAAERPQVPEVEAPATEAVAAPVEAEPTPSPEGEPAPEGDVAPSTAPAEATPTAEAGTGPSDGAQPATAPASAPEPDRGALASSALAQRTRAHKARSARARLLAAAGGQAKKA